MLNYLTKKIEKFVIIFLLLFYFQLFLFALTVALISIEAGPVNYGRAAPESSYGAPAGNYGAPAGGYAAFVDGSGDCTECIHQYVES